jgi:predicted polyphosphate/ATP-dependent NAD kinase
MGLAYRVVVTGGRHYGNRPAVFAALDALAKAHGSLFVMEGGSTGADKFAREWRQSRLHPGKTYRADWETHHKAAGPIRNGRMLAEGEPDEVLVFPGGAGTADMVAQATAAGVPVRHSR